MFMTQNKLMELKNISWKEKWRPNDKKGLGKHESKKEKTHKRNKRIEERIASYHAKFAHEEMAEEKVEEI